MTEIDYSAWSKNVIDEFKLLSEEEIKSKLEERYLPFAVCFDHFAHDFNFSSGIRNANNFGAREIFYLGQRRFDRRGAVGVLNYSKPNYLSSFDELKILKSKYSFVGIENNISNKTISLSNFNWKPNSLMIFGSESAGISPEIIEMCDFLVEIPSFGSVRSINCGSASAISMYDFVSKFQKNC